jgi:hypothetical protein
MITGQCSQDILLYLSMISHMYSYPDQRGQKIWCPEFWLRKSGVCYFCSGSGWCFVWFCPQFVSGQKFVPLVFLGHEMVSRKGEEDGCITYVLIMRGFVHDHWSMIHTFYFYCIDKWCVIVYYTPNQRTENLWPVNLIRGKNWCLCPVLFCDVLWFCPQFLS